MNSGKNKKMAIAFLAKFDKKLKMENIIDEKKVSPIPFDFAKEEELKELTKYFVLEYQMIQEQNRRQREITITQEKFFEKRK